MVLVLNKSDLTDLEHANEIKEEFMKTFDLKEVFIISSATKDGVQDLLNYIYVKLDEVHDITVSHVVEDDPDAFNNDDSDYEIVKLNKNTYTINGGKLKRLASVTDIKNTGQIKRYTNILDSMGIFDALRGLGIQNGDTIVVAGIELTYDEDYY